MLVNIKQINSDVQQLAAKNQWQEIKDLEKSSGFLFTESPLMQLFFEPGFQSVFDPFHMEFNWWKNHLCKIVDKLLKSQGMYVLLSLKL